MISQRATAHLRAAGIEHLVIVKRLWGAAPEDPRLRRQMTACSPTWQAAVQAGREGFRPTEGRGVRKSVEYRQRGTML